MWLLFTLKSTEVSNVLYREAPHFRCSDLTLLRGRRRCETGTGSTQQCRRMQTETNRAAVIFTAQNRKLDESWGGQHAETSPLLRDAAQLRSLKHLTVTEFESVTQVEQIVCSKQTQIQTPKIRKSDVRKVDRASGSDWRCESGPGSQQKGQASWRGLFSCGHEKAVRCEAHGTNHRTKEHLH